jgi:hypothetical protein
MLWPTPAKDADPWFESFESMVTAMDSAGYAAREDRNVLLSEGGDVSFVASTGLLSWSSGIVLLSPISPFKMTLPAGSVNLLDGQRLYVNVTRPPLGNLSLSGVVANQIPNTNDALLLAVRNGTFVYWRNGGRIEDGQTKTLFDSGTSASQIDVIKLSTRESHDSVTPLVVGGDAFNPTDYDKPGFSRTLTFRAVAANGDIGMTTTVVLYNVTDSDLVATLTFTSTNPAKDEVVLVEGSGAGEIDLLDKLYEVRIALTVPPGSPTETVELLGAEIVVVSTTP